jgi:transcriptional regulator with XRE-family HTH domain
VIKNILSSYFFSGIISVVKTFGDRIRLIRHAFGFNQAKIAEIGETFTQNVSRWEKHVFEPSIPVKKLIAEKLGLSLDWLVSGEGFPFAVSRVVDLAPQGKYVTRANELLSLAIQRSVHVEVAVKHSALTNAFYVILLSPVDSPQEHSAVILHAPPGYEKVVHNLLLNFPNVRYGEPLSFPDTDKEKEFITNFGLILNYFQRGRSSEPEISPEKYFFIELYNVSKDELIPFIFSKAKSVSQKLDKLMFEKFVPDILNAFQHHHKQFKKIVRKWVEGEKLSDKEKTIIDEFVGSMAVSKFLGPRKRDIWETFLIEGIKKNKMEPYSMAYAELVSLIITAGQNVKIRKPMIDEENDRLYWR